MRSRGIIGGLVASWTVVGTACAGLMFDPAPGYDVTPVWSGADAAHFAVDGGANYIYGATDVGGGQFRNVVRLYDGAATVTIAESPNYGGSAYSPDAITALNGEVYWAHVGGMALAGVTTLFKTWHDGAAWNTTTVFDESAGINVFSLSTDGDRVFGVGLDSGGANVAFYLDDDEAYQVFAEVPGYSGGSGFDVEGNFFTGATDVSFATHMYEFSADQVADRINGIETSPYPLIAAVNDHVVPGNGSPVMESDGALLYGVGYNNNFSGTTPFAYDLDAGTTTLLGTLSGATTVVATDMYDRDGGVFFLAKDNWGTGQDAVIYQLVPEPSSVLMLVAGATIVATRRKRNRTSC